MHWVHWTNKEIIPARRARAACTALSESRAIKQARADRVCHLSGPEVESEGCEDQTLCGRLGELGELSSGVNWVYQVVAAQRRAVWRRPGPDHARRAELRGDSSR